MSSTTPRAVRCGLIGVFTVLATALIVPNALAQFGPRPPINRPPTIPRPPGFGGGGLPGIPENIYYCKKCNTELGRGLFPPLSATCACGLTYRNGTAWDNGRNPPPGGAGIPNPGMPAPPPQAYNPPPSAPRVRPQPRPQPVSLPELPAVFADTALPGDNTPLPAVNSAPPDTTNTVPSPPVVVPPKSSGRWLVIIGGVVLGLLVILGMIVGVLYTNAKAKQAQPVRRRLRDLDDE